MRSGDHAEAASFERGQPVVGTTYFYWYDVGSKAHIVDHDGTDALTTHPADMDRISYKAPAWHRRQLLDMVDARIDFLMPVYWGVPGQYDGWSFAGLPPLVEAHSRLEAEGVEPPVIGMFYDTSILQHNRFNADGSHYRVDLTTEFGKRWFYTAIRDFWSLVPPARWARVDGRPITFLYAPAFAKAQDGAFRPTEPVIVSDSGQWKTVGVPLAACRFMNRCNGADFRLAVTVGQLELAVRHVVLQPVKQARN